MLLRRHPHFLGCHFDTFCSKKSVLSVMEVFARLILKEESDMVDETEVPPAEKSTVIHYNWHWHIAACGLKKSACDHEEVADLTLAGWSWCFVVSRLGTVWQLATTLVLWYMLTSSVNKAAGWHTVGGSWRLQGRGSRIGQVTSMIKSYIEITLTKMRPQRRSHAR